MSMFNFFTDKAKAMAPAPVISEVEKERRRRLVPYQRPLSTPVDPANPLPELNQSHLSTEGTSSGYSEPRPQLLPRSEAPPPIMSPLDRQRLKTSAYRDVTGPAVYDDQNRQISGKPVNNDRGVMGRIGDVLRQAVISAGESYNTAEGNPEQRLMAAIGGGISGGFVGGFKPTVDEERQRLRNIHMSEGEENRILGVMDQDITLGAKQADVTAKIAAPYLKSRELDNEATQIQNTAVDKERTALKEMWEEDEEFDPNDPKNAQLVLRAQAIGWALPKRIKGKDYNFSWSPDGKLAVGEKNSGDVKLAFGGQSFAKPVDTNPNDFDDDRFPWLMSEKKARLEAMGSVAPDADGVVVNEQTQSDLMNFQREGDDGQLFYPFRNADGSFNKNQFINDAAIDGLVPMSYGSLYRTQARSIANKVAQKEKALLDGSAKQREAVSTFRSLIRGVDVATANTSADYLNEIMALKSESKRKAGLTKLWDILKKAQR